MSVLLLRALDDLTARLTDWQGTAAALAQLALVWLPPLQLSPDPAPTERLVRFYVSSGVLAKPVKSGRESLFGAQQVLQFFAARRLLADGWPLAKIADALADSSPDELRDFIAGSSGHAWIQPGDAPPTAPEFPVRETVLRVRLADGVELLISSERARTLDDKTLHELTDRFADALRGAHD